MKVEPTQFVLETGRTKNANRLIILYRTYHGRKGMWKAMIIV